MVTSAFERMSRNFLCVLPFRSLLLSDLHQLIHRFKVMIKAEHAGDTCSAFSDVVNFVVGRTQDLQGVPWWSTYQVLGK
ncbi:Uncharacterised protein [Escherichia coli]|uniref:Uncharacterized protein n=1 Tax=Escherichia coli TaxID=562 RepID=A0A376TJ63_ECOLX|nr:Uncharacterised protein [Escherichia coli]